MGLTLNQIIKRFRSLALSHHQLKGFYFLGAREAIDLNPDADFGVCIVQQLPGEINRTEKLSTFRFRVYFLDKTGVSEETNENEQDVVSDMSQVAEDFLSLLYASDYQFDWDITTVNEATPHVEFIENWLAGCSVALGVSVPYLADRCSIPADNIEPENEFDMARTRIYPYSATGNEGDTWSIEELSGKHILAAWRAGSYKRPVATSPDDDEKIQVGTESLESGKGVLGNGTVVLRTGDAPIANEKFDFLYYA